MTTERVVLDTNVLISRILWPPSVPAKAVALAARRGRILISDTLIAELADVLARPKFSAYVTPDEARRFIQVLGGLAETVSLTENVAVCRDPKDNHILSLSISGRADVIVTGDADLLTLNPFRGVPIIRTRDFVDRQNPGTVY